MPESFDLQWHGQQATAAIEAAAVRGLQLAGEHLLGVSRKQVPHEQGELERLSYASVDESSLTVAVSYDTPYAVRQHEEMSYQHDAGRKAKYLEDPMNAEKDTMYGIIAAQIRRATQ